MSWLFVIALGIIWVAFLLPFGARRASPASTVEEFERKMDLLAETNRSPTGRWVLVPRKGERFLGSRDRQRLRVRRRRRLVFTVLLEATAVALLIGLFPPLRPMLMGAAVLGGVLFVYVLLLLRLRVLDIQQERAVRARRLHAARFERIRIEELQRAAYLARASNGNGHPMPDGNGHANGNGNGHVLPQPADADDGVELYGAGARFVDDDVHVVIRRTSELDAERSKRMAR